MKTCLEILTFSKVRLRADKGVMMSSCLCKKLEGAVFPFQIKSLEDGVDDSIHVDKAYHGPGFQGLAFGENG
jgi:hypothetical protein